MKITKKDAEAGLVMRKSTRTVNGKKIEKTTYKKMRYKQASLFPEADYPVIATKQYPELSEPISEEEIKSMVVDNYAEGKKEAFETVIKLFNNCTTTQEVYNAVGLIKAELKKLNG